MRPSAPFCARAKRGPHLFHILGRNEFALRQGFALQNACTRLCARRLRRWSSWVCGSFCPLSSAAPSASASARPRCGPAPHFAPAQNGDPIYSTSSGEMNSPCGKVLPCKTLVRAYARGGFAAGRAGSVGLSVLSAPQLHQLLLQLALDAAQRPILRPRKTGTPFIPHPRAK